MEAGEGHRLLEIGERIQAGDMYWGGAEWHPTGKAGQILRKHDGFYERKVSPVPTPDPGEGYRLINNLTDTPVSGDEIWIGATKGWKPRDEDQVGTCFREWSTYRRKVSPAPEPAPEVDPGEGYRLISPGEAYIQGDQFLRGDVWAERLNWGGVCQANHIPQRRRVTEPSKYLDRKFKQRDLVRIKFKDELHRCWQPGMDSTVGEIGMVAMPGMMNDEYELSINGDVWTYRESNLELVTDPSINTDHLTYCHGTAIQVLLRSSRESDPASSLREARDLIEREIARLGR